MPLYFYHLKFELYATPESLQTNDVWAPGQTGGIFDDLPAHPKAASRSAKRSEKDTDTPSGADSLQNLAEDWRFGSVSVETSDPVSATTMAASESSRAGAAAAPMLGPSFSGSGTATKAKCIPTDTKNTELGWGVVHFYRDEDESRGLRVPGQEQQADNAQAAPDCTTLCIPAVPAYMSPGDFMGFLGERWHGDISHCRLVMTSRMNRYLVLLKFRDNKSAKEWKRQFDGKVFNTMEVSHTIWTFLFATNGTGEMDWANAD